MENSPRYREATNLIPSPRCHNNNNSCSMSSSSESNKPPTTPTRHVTTTRSESGNPYPTTFVQADTSSFKQVVQMLTGSSDRPKHGSSLKPNPTTHHHHHHHQPDPTTTTRSTPSSSSSFSIPPIKAVPNKKQSSSSSSSGFRLYERRNSMKNLKINPLNPVFNPVNSAFSPRKHEILSPSILDFPSLVLSPVTPLIPDPFDRSGSSNQSPEEKAIKEKGFYLHPSPATTPMDPEPRLLPLFPVTSPRVSGSSSSASSTS